MKRNKSYIVGIAGGSASGKTTFVAELIKILAQNEGIKVEVVGMDKYFYRGQNGGPSFTSPSTGETLPDNNVPGSADNARLVADLDLKSTAEDSPDILIVEGLMTLHIEDIRQRCDLRIFIDLDADLRALRRMLRDIKGGRGSADPEFISTYYRECARVGHANYVEPSRVHADLILRGDSDFSRTAAIVVQAISNRRNLS